MDNLKSNHSIKKEEVDASKFSFSNKFAWIKNNTQRNGDV